MSTRQDEALGPPIEKRSELVEWFALGEKPGPEWRIGTEYEKIPFRLDNLVPVTYEGVGGISRLMEGMISRFGWEPVMEGSNVIALRRGQAMVSLEPAGQFELSGATLSNLHETRAELLAHLDEVRVIGEELGIGFSTLGHVPTWGLAEMPSMPKGRYAIMKRYMPQVGSAGLDMMYRTATVQVNLDFDSEMDMVKKLRVSMKLQSVVSAFFANSPFRDGQISGLLSTRCNTWLDTDTARSGIPRFVFETGMGYERYTDYALDVPMYFVYRGGRYIDVAGESFKHFMEGRLPQLPGELPRLADWTDHVSTLFPDVRLKQYLEMRGADTGDIGHLCALPALWVGLLYDSMALDSAWDLVKDISAEEVEQARRDVPVLGLNARYGVRTVLSVGREMLEVALNGLHRRRICDDQGRDESIHLRSAQETAVTGVTPAELLLMKFKHGWAGNAERALTETAI